MTKVARKFTIVVAGETDTDVDQAMEEAMRLIKAGNLAGSDQNAKASFYFDSTSDVAQAEMPAAY